MDKALRDYLRLIIAVALRIAPRPVKRAFAERTDEKHEAAIQQLSLSAADAVLTSFEVSRKADHLGPSAHSLFSDDRRSGRE